MLLALAIIGLCTPGLILLEAIPNPRRDPMVAIPAVLTAGLALHALTFWWLRPLGLDLTALYLGLAGLTVLFALARWRHWRAVIQDWSAPSFWVVAALVGVAVVRVVPWLYSEVPSGADMSMHAYMSRLILDQNGVPTTHLPLLPIDDFGTYAAALPSLAATLSHIAGVDLAASCFAIVLLIHWLVTPLVYATVRTRLDAPRAAFVAVLCSLAVRDPQHHVLWGGNPTVLSLLFAGYGLLCVDAQRERVGRIGSALAGAVLFAAALVSHAVIPYALIYLMPAVWLFGIYHTPANERMPTVGAAILMSVLALGLLYPYLSSFGLALTPAETAWIHDWQLKPKHVPWGPVWTWPATFVPHIGRRLGWFFLIALSLGVIQLVRSRARWSDHTRDDLWRALLWCLAALGLTINAVGWVLPASYALYPDRMMLLLLLPLSVVIGHAVATSTVSARVAVPLLVAFVAFPTWRHYWANSEHVPVQPDDRAAIVWLAQHTDPTDVIETNYGDAGLWIPALAGRATRTPHVNIVYMDDVTAWRDTVETRWLFIGAHRVYPGDVILTHDSVQDERWELAFESGAAAVYRRTD